MLKLKSPPEKPLGERIEQIRLEIEAFIDAKAEEQKKDMPGVPINVIRNILRRWVRPIIANLIASLAGLGCDRRTR
jgi:hypothetical protein